MIAERIINAVKKNVIGIQNGDNTQTQGQSIDPVNFRMIKTTPKILVKFISLLVVLLFSKDILY